MRKKLLVDQACCLITLLFPFFVYSSASADGLLNEVNKGSFVYRGRNIRSMETETKHDRRRVSSLLVLQQWMLDSKEFYGVHFSTLIVRGLFADTVHWPGGNTRSGGMQWMGTDGRIGCASVYYCLFDWVHVLYACMHVRGQ